MRAPMTGSAKQSMPQPGDSWIASSQALLAMTNWGIRFNCQTATPPSLRAREAIHLSTRGAMDCFAALAMTWKHTSAFSRRDLPELCIDGALKHRGAGKAGCSLHPQPCVQNKKQAHKHITTGSAKTLRLSPREWFYGLLRDSPVERACCHRSPLRSVSFLRA